MYFESVLTVPSTSGLLVVLQIQLQLSLLSGISNTYKRFETPPQNVLWTRVKLGVDVIR